MTPIQKEDWRMPKSERFTYGMPGKKLSGQIPKEKYGGPSKKAKTLSK